MTWEHGGYSYTNHKCRCDVCTAAHTEMQAAYRADRHGTIVPKDIHGKYPTYTNWGCRCKACTDAWATYNRELRARRKANV